MLSGMGCSAASEGADGDAEVLGDCGGWLMSARDSVSVSRASKS